MPELKLGIRLTNKIVLSDGTVNPSDTTGVLFVNDHPGVSVSDLANMATTDLLSAEDVFLKLCRNTFTTVKANFFQMLGKYISINTVFDTQNFKLSGTAKSGEGYISFDKNCLDAFVSFKLDKLIVKFNTATTVVVTILDGVTETTKDFDTTTGFNVLDIDHVFKSNNGRVSFDTGDLEIWETGTAYQYGCYTQCSPCNNYEIEGNIGYSSMCIIDKDEIMNMYTEDLNYTAYIQWFIKYCEELLTTTRSNPSVDMSRDQAATNVAYYGKPYDRESGEAGEYWTSIYRVVRYAKENIKINKSASAQGMRVVNTIL